MFKLNDPANNQFDLWLKANGMYVAIGAAAVLLIVVAILLILSFRKTRAKCEVCETKIELDVKELIGGAENIVSVSKVGSRISLELKDYTKVNEEELKKVGVLSTIRMSNKITLVCNKGDVESLFNSLN